MTEWILELTWLILESTSLILESTSLIYDLISKSLAVVNFSKDMLPSSASTDIDSASNLPPKSYMKLFTGFRAVTATILIEPLYASY